MVLELEILALNVHVCRAHGCGDIESIRRDAQALPFLDFAQGRIAAYNIEQVGECALGLSNVHCSSGPAGRIVQPTLFSVSRSLSSLLQDRLAMAEIGT